MENKIKRLWLFLSFLIIMMFFIIGTKLIIKNKPTSECAYAEECVTDFADEKSFEYAYMKNKLD